MKSKKFVVGIIVAACVGLLALAPVVLELRRISQTLDAYSFDSATFESVARHPQGKVTADEFLNPTFQKRYGLDMDKYLDDKGYFAPNGHHWLEWSTETKTAALLMWKPKAFASAWSVRGAIRKIDAYYLRNDKVTPVFHAVEAATEGLQSYGR